MSFIPSKVFAGITSKNGINFLKLRAGWGTSAGFATGYPVANTIWCGKEFSDISGVVSASQNTNLDLGNPNLQPELYSEVELDLKLNW
jgi:hypothetical protein